jgi:hypothetical protein
MARGAWERRAMQRAFGIPVLVVLVLALAAPALAAPKKPKPKPPPPPPDSAADCTFVVEPFVPDYLVLASIVAGVDCETTKQRIDVATELTRDGVRVPILPLGGDTPTCTNTSDCFVVFDLFSFDNHPVAFPGDQVYCASGSGVVGGVTVGPRSGCEQDGRI